MLKFVKSIGSSLLVWILLLIISTQMIILGVAFVLLNLSLERSQLSNLDSANKTAYASAIFESLINSGTELENLDKKIIVPGSQLSAWQHMLNNNPNIWYSYQDGTREVSGGLRPEIAIEDALLLIKKLPVSDIECNFFELTRRFKTLDAHSSVWLCKDEPPVFFEVGGLSSNYTPKNYWFQVAIGPEFNSQMLLLSYLLVALITPLILYNLLRPIRRISKAASQLTFSGQKQILPSKGVFTEMRGVVDSINGALSRIDQSFAREQQLRNAVAHELRTPLTALIGRLHTLPNSIIKDGLIGDAKRLKALINRIMDFARAAKYTENLVSLNLVRETRNACAQCSSFALQKGVNLNFESEKEKLSIYGETTAVSIILQNILTNALMHGGNISKIDVSVYSDGSLVISDNGIGISEELVDIIEKFPTSELYDFRYENIGFGMIIVFELLRLVGGSITCRRLNPCGTEFYLKFTITDHKI